MRRLRFTTALLVVFHVVLSTAVLLEAQTFQRLLGGEHDERPYCVEKTADNGYIICGEQGEFDNEV